MSVRSRTGVLGKGTPRVPPIPVIPPPGACVQPGNAQGEVLFWNEATQCYIPTTAPAGGDIFVYDAASGLVVPRQPLFSGALGMGANQLSTGTTFLFEWFGPAATGAIERPLRVPGPVGATMRIRNMRLVHSSPSGVVAITYTTRINGVNTALVIATTSGTVTAENVATELLVVAGDRLSCSSTHASGVQTLGTAITYDVEEVL